MRILGVTASSFELYGAYESIASATGTGSSATITFSSIPSTYQHLQIRGITRTTTDTPEPGNTFWDVTFNSDTSANYARHRINGNGLTVGALGESSQNACRIYSVGSRGTETNRMGACILDIHDYANTSKYKTVRAIGGIDVNAASTNGEISLTSGLWMNTSAITSITITIGSGNFATNSQISLYGIKGA